MRSDFDRPDFDRPAFEPPERVQRDRGDRGRPDRGRSDPGVTPLPPSAGRNDVEPEPATRQDLYGAPVSMPFRNAPAAPPPAADDLSGRGDAGSHGRSLPAREREQPGLPGPGQGPQPPAGPANRGRSAPGDYSGRTRGSEEPVRLRAGQHPRSVPGGGARPAARGDIPIAGAIPPPGRRIPGSAPRARPGRPGLAEPAGAARAPRQPRCTGPAGLTGAGCPGPGSGPGPAGLCPRAERPLQRAPAHRGARTVIVVWAGLADRCRPVGARGRQGVRRVGGPRGTRALAGGLSA